MRVIVLCFLTVFLCSTYAAPSQDALLLIEKLKIREFDRFLGPPRGLTAAQLESLETRFGIEALLKHVAAHFDATYSPGQIKGMLALWNDPHMQMLVSELIGTQAPINRLLSNWTGERQKLLTEWRKVSPSPSAGKP